jgi:hypothetical protein
MAFGETQWVSLVGHTTDTGGPVHGIDARVRQGQPGELVFHYLLRGELARVRVPIAAQQVPTARADGLWKHTCFEAFIVDPTRPGYYELNFSPSREWAAYRFNGYREGMSPADVTSSPAIDVRCFDDRLELDATLRLTSVQAVRSLKLALTAVVEDDSGRLSYWALRHAPGKPDFHHPNGFVLELTL